MQHEESYNTPQTYNRTRWKLQTQDFKLYFNSEMSWTVFRHKSVLFFLLTLFPNGIFLMINKLTKNHVDHNRNKIFDGDPKLTKIFGQFESRWLTVAVSSKISMCQGQDCKEHHDQENVNEIIIEIVPQKH